MRYTWIDGIYIEVNGCEHCPFLSTEMEIGATCQYPLNPANEGVAFSLMDVGEWDRKDCPLRVRACS